MTGQPLSRKFLYVAIAGVVVGGTLLAMFYGQYRWLAHDIVLDSAAEHSDYVRSVYRQRTSDRLADIAARFEPAGEPTAIRPALNRILIEHGDITGLRYSGASGESYTAGNFPLADMPQSPTELGDVIVVAAPIGQTGSTLGASFDLAPMRAEIIAYERQLEAHSEARWQHSMAWVGAATLAALLVCVFAIYLFSRDQNRRIRALKRQAEKLRDSDFGDRLPETRDDALGDLAAVFNTMRDRLRATTISRDYLDSILHSMNDAIIVTAEDGTIKRINRATTNLLGYEPAELEDVSIDFIVDTNKTGSLTKGTPSGVPRDAYFESKFGESIPVSYTCSILGGDTPESGERIYAAQNVTERRRAEQRIRYLARIDPLTKIPNRMQFQHLLQRAIARARRSAKTLCLFYIDIDGFKEINDTFGHLAGDTTLETVAERLSQCLPENTVIGRLAGDEFAVLVDGGIPGTESRSNVDALAKRLLARLADPFFVQGHEVFMTASMGIAFYPDDAPNVIDLIRNADAALYHAKKSGGNQFVHYVPRLNEAAVERLMTKSKLKRAFERDELLVHYQPKYNLETGQVFGVEALVRWELPERGLILPSDFIPIAEETNLIIEIGEWVLDKVCEDFRFWQRSVSSPGRVSVNLSLKQLRQHNFAKLISAILRSYEVSPTSLEFEITETTLMENPERTIKLLDQLYALGLHLAIDDFGTGYSSLSALQQFPISTLKIDKSFVRHATTNADDATLVSTIVQMGRNMQMDVVAEGVESEDQLVFLQSIGCTYAQGLLFGDPMSSDDFLELLLAQAEGTDSHRALFA